MNEHVLLNTDWLAVSVRLDDGVGNAPAHHRWVEYEGGTNVWKRRLVLINKYGEKVATLLCEPKTTVIDRDAALIEIANEWLYHGIGARRILDKIRVHTPFRITGLNRLDLAADFVPNDAMCDIIRGLDTGTFYVAGKRNDAVFHSINNDAWMPPEWRGVKIAHSTTWGHKTSDIRWKLYYKSKELIDAAGGMGWDKPYIVDAWREAHLDVSKVWRLEVSIHRCNGLLFDGDVLGWDAWYKHTCDLYRALYKSRFVVRKSEGHSERRRDAVVTFIPIETDSIVSNKPSIGDDVHSGRISLLRRLVQSMDEEEVLYDSYTRREVVGMVKKIVERDHLDRYFAAMVGMSVVEWEANCEERGGDGGVMALSMERDKIVPMSPNTDFDIPRGKGMPKKGGLPQ